MARVKSILGRLSGKMGGQVFVNSTKAEPHTRKPVEPGTKKHEPGLKKQYRRTRLLNKLAGSINDMAKAYSDNLRRADFYAGLNKRLRKAKKDSLYFLLKQLKGAEVNPKYKFAGKSIFNLHIEAAKNKIIVKMNVVMPPDPGPYRADCYFYEPLLMAWTDIKNKPSHQRKRTTWIPFKKNNPAIQFEFNKPARIKYWLLFLKIRLGRNNELIHSFKACGMQIVEVGTTDKKELAEWERLSKQGIKKKKAERDDVEVVEWS